MNLKDMRMGTEFKLLRFLISLCIIHIGCKENEGVKKIKGFQDFNISRHWVLKLPASPQESGIKDERFEKVYTFKNDSLLLKVSTGTTGLDEALTNYNFALKAERENLPVGICMGDFTGYYKFENFVDSLSKLGGGFVDTEENGKKEVSFGIVNATTGEKIDMLFQLVDSKNVDLIHAIFKNIRYVP